MKHSLVKNRHSCLARFSDFLTDTMGLYFPQEDWKGFERKLEYVATAFGFTDALECIEWLMKAPLTKEQITTLALYLTIGETYFFRDPTIFKLLTTRIFPEIICKNETKERSIRIWCAACSSGEEPYSIAISLHQLIPDLLKWNVTILGTDINLKFLQKAEAGVYKEWSFRTTPESIKEKYFQKKGDKYHLIPEVKKLVEFRYMNLVEDVYPSVLNGTNAMDVILCNNVLIYFSQKQIHKVIHQLTSSLIQGGWLCVSAIETPYVKDSRIKSHHLLERTIFKKITNKVLDEQQGSEQGLDDEYPFFKQPVFVKGLENKDNLKTHLKVELPAFLNLPSSTPEFNFSAIEKKESSPNIEMQVLRDLKNKDALVSKEHVDDLDVVYAEASMLFNHWRYQEAIDKLEMFFSPLINHPESIKSHINAIILLIRAYANQGKLNEARQWCHRALHCEKLDPLLYYLYATILQEQKLDVEASYALKHVLYLDHDFVMAHFGLGNLLIAQKNEKEAQRHFRNALDLLQKLPEEEQLIGAEGITVERLTQIIVNMKK